MALRLIFAWAAASCSLGTLLYLDGKQVPETVVYQLYLHAIDVKYQSLTVLL